MKARKFFLLSAVMLLCCLLLTACRKAESHMEIVLRGADPMLHYTIEARSGDAWLPESALPLCVREDRTEDLLILQSREGTTYVSELRIFCETYPAIRVIGANESGEVVHTGKEIPLLLEDTFLYAETLEYDCVQNRSDVLSARYRLWNGHAPDAWSLYLSVFLWLICPIAQTAMILIYRRREKMLRRTVIELLLTAAGIPTGIAIANSVLFLLLELHPYFRHPHYEPTPQALFFIDIPILPVFFFAALLIHNVRREMSPEPSLHQGDYL